MSGPAWQTLAGLPAWEITQIPRPPEPADGTPSGGNRPGRQAAQRLQLGAQRHDSPRAQLAVRRTAARHAELRQAEATGLWEIRLLAGSDSPEAAAQVAGLLCSSSSVTSTLTTQGWTRSWPKRESSPISGLPDPLCWEGPAVQVTDLEMAMLHAQITGNDETARRTFSEKLAVSGDLSGLAALAHAAFVIAARRKFTPQWSRAEVIRYVAQVRTLLSERPALLDPLTAEDELRGALGDPVTVTHEVGSVAAARLSLLLALVASLDLDDEAVANLLGQARDIANRMLDQVRDPDPWPHPRP